jgi:hypothetical protein
MLTLDKLNKRAEAKIYLESAVNTEQNFRDKEQAKILLKEWNLNSTAIMNL